MAGIIERNAKTPLTLKQRSGISDGKSVFGTEIPCLAMVFGFSRNDRNEFGNVQNGKVFLIAPLDAPPAIPGFIVYDENDYEIKLIKTIRNLKSVVLGYRVVTVGAS